MVRLILCKCIRISVHVRMDVIFLALSCLIIVAAWSNGSNVTYSLSDSVADHGIYHKIQLQSPIMSNEVSSLYYAMKDVSNGGAIYNFPLTIGSILTGIHTW